MKWVQKVKTVSTFPPEDTFKKSGKEVARIMANPKVSPKGLGSAIRMVQYFINRGGKGLPAAQKRELEKAKHILQKKQDKEKNSQRDEKKTVARQTQSRRRNSTASHSRKQDRRSSQGRGSRTPNTRRKE